MTGFNSWRWLLDLGWFFFLVLLFYHFWRERQLLIQAKSWLKVKGRITDCELTKVGSTVWPQIEYSYQVHDKDLVGHYLFLDTWHNNPNSRYARNIAYKAALAYRDHLEVEVYYNPNSPEQSALDVTVPQKLDLILGVIGVCTLFHLTIIVHRLIT